MLKKYKDFLITLEKLSKVVYKELGDGFDEDLYQRGLAFEFRQANISYLRETNIETFYKNQMLALRELDFLLPKQKNKKFNLTNPVIIECKYDAKISDRHRSQLRQYLKSIPLNATAELQSINHGILLNWQKTNVYDETRIASSTPIQIELWSYDKKNDMRLMYRNFD
jgi:GxxExxY protein